MKMDYKRMSILVLALGLIIFNLGCSNEPAKTITETPSSILTSITIPEEQIININNSLARAIEDDTLPADVLRKVMKESRGTICLYFLKYGLSQLEVLKHQDGFGETIYWGIFKNDENYYGSKTEEYLDKYWNYDPGMGMSMKSVIDNFDMGYLKVLKGNSDDKYIVYQTDMAGAFQHYIILTKNKNNFDIDFYAFEKMPPDGIYAYCEQTKYLNDNEFVINRYFYEPDGSDSITELLEKKTQFNTKDRREFSAFIDHKIYELMTPPNGTIDYIKCSDLKNYAEKLRDSDSYSYYNLLDDSRLPSSDEAIPDLKAGLDKTTSTDILQYLVTDVGDYKDIFSNLNRFYNSVCTN